MTILEVSGRSYGGAGIIVRALKVLAENPNSTVNFLVSQGEEQNAVITKILNEIEVLEKVTNLTFPIELYMEDINGSSIKIPA